MNRVTRGSVLLVALAGVLSCSGDPTSSLRNGVDHLLATPSALYVDNNGDKLVVITAVDAQGNTLAEHFAVGSVGTGITVVEDSTYLPVNKNGVLVQPSSNTSARFIVTPTAYDSTEFTITAGGKSITIPVRVSPASLTTPLSKASAQYGDTITVTAPTGLAFDSTASIVTLGIDTCTIISRSSTAISFVPGLLAVTGKPTVTKVSALYAPAAGAVTVPTSGALTLPPTPTIALNETNANVGDTIVATLPGALRYTASSTPSVGATGVQFLGIVDSTHLRFRVGAGAVDSVSVSDVIISGIPAKSYTVTSGSAHLQSTPIPTLAAGVSTLTPHINGTVTITAPAGIKFLPGAAVFFDKDEQVVTSIAADSGSLIFRAHRSGKSGTVRIGNAAFGTATTLPFTAPLPDTLTVDTTVVTLGGTTSLATAPLVVIPPSGFSSGVIDNDPFTASADCAGGPGGAYCTIYKFVLTGTTTFSVTATWSPNYTDVGVYFADASDADAGPGAACDQNGRGPTASPEACTVTLGAGTYYIEVNGYGPLYPQNDPLPTEINVTWATQ